LDIETSSVAMEHKEEDFFTSMVTGTQQQQVVDNASSSTSVNNEGLTVSQTGGVGYYIVYA